MIFIFWDNQDLRKKYQWQNVIEKCLRNKLNLPLISSMIMTQLGPVLFQRWKTVRH